ncbi:MAG: hypothetical protein HYU69_05370 [Bacteroidetes bacterium]|nr:hypothetical protein [Bacteroidota bacterium]
MTYLMVPVVIAIWAYVFYSIFGNKDKPDKDLLHPANAARLNNTTGQPVDTFSIKADYRDPFLDKLMGGEQPKSASAIKTPPVKVQPLTTWPQVAYFGIIKNQTGNKQLALLQINGKQSRMQLNQMAGDITLMKITKDSVQVKFGKEMKYVRR